MLINDSGLLRAVGHYDHRPQTIDADAQLSPFNVAVPGCYVSTLIDYLPCPDGKIPSLTYHPFTRSLLRLPSLQPGKAAVQVL